MVGVSWEIDMLLEIVGGCFMGVFFLALWKAVMDNKKEKK
jgi:hypothetical protein